MFEKPLDEVEKRLDQDMQLHNMVGVPTVQEQTNASSQPPVPVQENSTGPPTQEYQLPEQVPKEPVVDELMSHALKVVKATEVSTPEPPPDVQGEGPIIIASGPNNVQSQEITVDKVYIGGVMHYLIGIWMIQTIATLLAMGSRRPASDQPEEARQVSGFWLELVELLDVGNKHPEVKDE